MRKSFPPSQATTVNRIREIDEAIAEAIRIREAMEGEIHEINMIAVRLSAERTILLSAMEADVRIEE